MAMEDCLARVGEHFGVESVGLGGMAKSGELMSVLHSWGQVPPTEAILADVPPPGPEMVAQFCRDGSFVCDRLEDLDHLPQFRKHLRGMRTVAVAFWAHRDLGSHVDGMALGSGSGIFLSLT